MLPSKGSSLHCVTCFRVSPFDLSPFINLCLILQILINLLVGGLEIREADPKVRNYPFPELWLYGGCGIGDGDELASVICWSDGLKGRIR